MKHRVNTSKSSLSTSKNLPLLTQGAVISLSAFIIFGILMFSCLWVGHGCEDYLRGILRFLAVVAKAF